MRFNKAIQVIKENNLVEDFEEMMQDIAVIVKHRINEAYDNQLLEEYGAKDIFNDLLYPQTGISMEVAHGTGKLAEVQAAERC